MSARAQRHAPYAAVVLVGWIAVAAPAAAAVFRVGNDGIPPCTHTTLAAAVAAAAANGPGLDQIYLSDATTLTSTIDINNSAVEIVGGFTDCSDDTPAGQTSITMQANPGFLVHGGTSTRTVNLQNLQVIRSGAGGRILQIQDKSLVTLYATLLSNGQADNGANVWMSGPDTILYINGSSVYSGDATGIGGGIYCGNGGTVLLDSGRIGDNTAGADGGGVYLDNCTMNAFAGVADRTVTCPGGGAGIVCNRADAGHGAGVFLTNGATLNLLGGALAPATVAENVADYGGGIYATGSGTTVEAHNAWFVHNLGSLGGGGIYLRNGAALTLDSDESDCAGGVCSLFERNFSSMIGGVGGALAIDGNADATVFKTIFTLNDANVTGSVAWVDGAGSTLTLEGVIAHHDSGSLNDAFVQADHGGHVTVGFSTFDEDTGCCKGIFDTNNSGSSVELYSSILMAISESAGSGRIFDDAPGAGESRFADCILYQETASSLPAPPDAGSYEQLVGESAVFANLAAGDYRLRRGSQPVDYCDTFRYTPQTTDIEQQPRGWDDPDVQNNPFGPYDLGADEWRPIFLGDFEPGDCSQWSGGTGC